MKSAMYSVQAVASLVGITPHTLRAWETRHQVVEPRRAPSGHRRYAQPEVDRLQRLATLVRRGHAISDIASLTDARLDALLQADAGRGAGATAVVLQPAAERRFELLVDAIDRFDAPRVVAHLKWLRTVLGVREFVLGAAIRLFAHIGAAVAASRLSISQEHALSAIIRDQLGDTIHSMQALSAMDDVAAETVVFAAPEDDLHEFGILLSAALAGINGLGIYYAGANLPAKSLGDAARAVKSKLVVLSNAPVPASERRVSFDAYLLALDASLPKGCALVIGGNGDRPRHELPSGRRMTYLMDLVELEDEFRGLV